MGGAGTILVVEDDAGIRESIAECLQGEGFTVVHARDGAEGLLRVGEQRPDLIVCDLMMPVMSGIQFLDRLRAEPRHRSIPVVLMTGASQATAGRFPAADAVLPKPFEIDELIALVHRLHAHP